jgi:hypothetical protein
MDIIKYLNKTFIRYPIGHRPSRLLFKFAVEDYWNDIITSKELSFLATLIYYEWNDTFEVTANWPRDFEKVLFEATELDWHEEQARSKKDPKARKKYIEIRKLLKEFTSKM